MDTYHKINTAFKRDPKTKKILLWDWSKPEFEYLKDCDWVFTEKVDGTNIRVIWDGQEISFKGKTDNADIPKFLLENLHKIFDGKVDLFKAQFGETPVCLYGEGYGDRIQKVGKLYRPDSSFILFDVKIGKWWLERIAVENIANEIGIDIVPIGCITTLNSIIKSFIAFKTQDHSMLSQNAPMEGLVGTPLIPLLDRGGERIIVKIKFVDFRGL